MRKDRYVVEVDKATRDYINEVKDQHNDANPGAGWRQKDTVRWLVDVHRTVRADLSAADEAERAS